MRICLNCQTPLQVTRLRCGACHIQYEGTFEVPPLGRIGSEHQRLAEEVLLAGGNLSTAARVLEISQPTLRKRLNGLIAALQELRSDDDRAVRQWLDDVEAGRLTPEAAARLIKERRGGL
jgi:hypothetical protein